MPSKSIPSFHFFLETRNPCCQFKGQQSFLYLRNPKSSGSAWLESPEGWSGLMFSHLPVKKLFQICNQNHYSVSNLQVLKIWQAIFINSSGPLKAPRKTSMQPEYSWMTLERTLNPVVRHLPHWDWQIQQIKMQNTRSFPYGWNRFWSKYVLSITWDILKRCLFLF